MKDETSNGKQYNVSVSAEIVNGSGISVEQVRYHITQLAAILGTKFNVLVPRAITDTPTLQSIVDTSQRLQKLKQCDGFDRHIRTYTRRQLQSSKFVTLIASYLVDKVDKITLEPLITGRSKKSDILVNFREERVYLECKHVETLRFDYSQEHEHMFSILRDYIHSPHQISIRYKKPLSDMEVHDLGKTLTQRVSEATGDGMIINNQDLEVQVMKRAGYADKRFAFTMVMITKDLHDNCSYPGHFYARDGITLSLSGPKVDYTKVLREKLQRSRSQSPPDSAYTLVIDGNRMLGDLTENLRALSTAFQPETNTRFSAAVLASYFSRIGSPELDFNFSVVSNPFAKFPISRQFEYLFQSHIRPS